MSTRRTFLKSSAALMATGAAGLSAGGQMQTYGQSMRATPAASPEPDVPDEATGPVKNILWICTDQQRWDTLGVTGNKFVHTPNLDKLADEGVLFERAYCNNPVCMPSRASFLTGTYPTTVEVPTNGYEIKDKYLDRLITYRLHKLGYNNGLSGKLHIRGSKPGNPALPESGYDHGYDEFNWSPCGFPANWGGCQYQHWLRDLGVPFDIKDHPLSKHVQVGVSAEHHQTAWCAQRAITFMRGMAKTNPDQPWMFACNIFDPHNPNDPPPELLERYMDMLEDIPLPNYEEGELEHKTSYQRDHHDSANKRMPPHPLRYDDLSDREHRLYRASYYAMIDLIDQQVGRIMQTLEETGQRDDTLVIFTSDHGESLGDHGLYWKAWWLYEESMRVPLIMSWPGMKPKKRRVQEFAELVDIVPTIYDAIGTNTPSYVQGKSWWPFLNGGEPVQRDHVFSEVWSGDSRDLAMVRDEHFKLNRCFVADEGELYDLREQPLERTNHYGDPAYSEVQARLQAVMDRRRRDVQAARLPEPEPTA